MVAANSSGSVFTWGSGFFGQLGQNNSSSTSSPVAVGALVARSGTNTIAAGRQTTFVIDSNQRLWAWGSNSQGTLGDGSTGTKSSPVQIGSSSWLQVSAKDGHTLAIRSDGRLFAWGNGSSGQLGNGSTIPASSPIAIGTSSWIFIAAGLSTSAAIRSDNTIWTWGFNGNSGYLLGEGGFGNHRSSPVQVGAGGLGAGAGGVWSWVSVGASNMHAIKSDNSLWVWGIGGIQTGLNSVASWSSPVSVSGGLSNPSVSYIAVASTTSNAVAIMRSSGYTNNMLVIWGNSPANGALANNSTSISNPIARGVKTTATVRSSPVGVNIMSGRSSLNSISAGDGCIFATTSISPSFPMFHLGNTNNGLANVNTNKDATAFFRGYPTPVNAWDALWVKTPIEYDSTTSWIAIGSQYGTTVVHAIRSNGSLWSWGGNMFGQAGLGNSTAISVPTQVGTSSWSAVSTGVSHALAIRLDGGLFAWGNGSLGQLGQGNTTSTSSPVQIGTSSWITLGTLGLSTSGAIRSDGGLFMWGNNTFNSVGLIPQGSPASHRSSPIQIGTSSWTQVSIGSSNAFAVRSDGQLFAWGSGTATGGWNSTITSYSSPVAIASGLTVTKIGVNAPSGSNGTAALATNLGSLYTWGDFSNGLMADSQTATAKSSPVQVGGSEGRRSSPVQIGALAWSNVYAGNEISAGKIVSTGALYTWGSNTVGQLGQNTNVVLQYIPLQIGSSSWTIVSAGNKHVLALK
jgi:alpha-tubulin suppressor-like RCC1 family protein